MESFETNIKILTDIVIKKNEMLDILLNIITNQKTLLELVMNTSYELSNEQATEIKQIFSEMIKEKNNHMTKINESDQVFATIFTGLENFEEQSKNHREIVRNLQSHVQIATDLDMKIRIAENENENFIKAKDLKTAGYKAGTSSKTISKTEKSPVSKRKIMDSYKNNNDFKK